MNVLPRAMVLVLGWLSTTNAFAQLPVRQTIPDEHPGPPYYSRALVDPSLPVVPIVFYRPPAKVPADFNLVDFFDIPRAWSVEPLQMTGFHILKEPFVPIQQNLSGNSVPIWFVQATALALAASDGVVMIGELEQIVSHKGVATRFREILQPSAEPGLPGGAKVGKINIVAGGQLDDGRLFSLHAVSTAGIPIKVRLSIK